MLAMKPILHHHIKFSNDWCRDIAVFLIFSDFQDGGRRDIGFSKILNFNDCPAVRG